MITIKDQKFGVEIELTGITRNMAAQVIADYYQTSTTYLGGSYYVWGATDSKGRTWKAMRDGSINIERRAGNGSYDEYSCEVVTPILVYEDLDDLQNIIRLLRAKGAVANSSCGIHVHVDGANHTPESLTSLMNFAVSRQDLFYEALNIGDRANRWCKKMNPKLLKAMKKADKTVASMERVWYSEVNDNYYGGIDHQHYNPTRYHGINLHAFFSKGTVEFRLFNGTTHAGKIKAYVQFCLAVSAWAINAKQTYWFTKVTSQSTREDKLKAMNDLLTRRFHLTGDEFETCRLHLTKAFQ